MSGRGLPAPRDWVADGPFPWPAARSLPDGATLRACFCVVDCQLARTRGDQPYLRLTLTDRNGPLEARVWERAEALLAVARPGSFVGVQGHIEYFNGQLQLCVELLAPVRVDPEDLAHFLPRSARRQDEMERELGRLIASVGDAGLRALLQACLGPESRIGSGFRLAPAAKYNHHAFLAGLLEHTLSVAAVCELLAGHYGPAIDRDLLLTAALLHDIGKVREIGARAGFPYTDEGKLLGHILLGLELVAAEARAVPTLDPGRLLLLKHLIAAHQGRYEWQSPREPATLEALVLHYADDLDAKVQQVRELLAEGQGAWTDYDRSFRREFLRHLQAPDAQSALLTEDASAAPAPVPSDSAISRTEAPPPAAPVNPGPPATPAGGAGHRPPRPHGPSGLHLSEDTLDLFGDRPEH